MESNLGKSSLDETKTVPVVGSIGQDSDMG